LFAAVPFTDLLNDCAVAITPSLFVPQAPDTGQISLAFCTVCATPLSLTRLNQNFEKPDSSSLQPQPLQERKLATMDIVLEAFDTFISDPIYAQLFPATPGREAYNAIKSMTGNSTFSKSTTYYNNYQYQPASQYISFSPSKYAYMSSLQRDNAWRQATSLFTITWYGNQVRY